SNISAFTLIEFDLFGLCHVVTDGGAFLFPLTYILGDVLAEVYGFRAARRAIVLGFVVSVLASLSFFAVQHAPPASDWGNQAAFEAVLGFVQRIVADSLSGYQVGQLLKAHVLVSIMHRPQVSTSWAR